MENIKDRIKKLLNLANNAGATEAEAMNAMAMAHALMAKYNIELDLTDHKRGDSKVVESAKFGHDLDSQYHRILGGAAGVLYNCEHVIYRPSFAHAFIGRAENIDAALWTFQWLVNQVEGLYKQNLPKGLPQSVRSEFRRTFKFACANRVYHRAQAIVQELKTNNDKAIEYTGSNALAIVKSIDQQLAEVKEFCSNVGIKEGPKMKHKGGNGTMAGFKAGDKVQLHKTLG